METESSISTKMEYSISQQRAARSETVQNASAKMELCLTDIQVSLKVFNSKLEKLRCGVKNQKSLEDVYETMRTFRTYFSDVKDYSKTIEDSFERQLGIILGEDYDRQLLCIENNGSRSPNQASSDQNLVSNDFKPICSKDLQKLDNGIVQNESSISPDLTRSICAVGDESAKSRLEETDQSSQCNNNQIDNDLPPKENALQNFSNSYESYDSSNDLPEAQANVLAVSKQMPDCPVNTPYSNPAASNGHCDTSPTDAIPVLVSNVIPDSELEKDRSPEDKSSEKNTALIVESQMSESLQCTSAPTLFEASQDDHPCENELPPNSPEKQDADQQNDTNPELELKMDEKTPGDLDSCLEDSAVKDLKSGKKKTKRRNEMDATSKKVNDWLNTSVQSGHLSDENASNGGEFQDLDDRGDKDADSTQIRDFGETEAADVMESGDDKSLVSAINNNDNSSTSTKVFSGKPGKSQSNVNILLDSNEDEEVIELSDDDIVATSIRIKKGSPISKFNQQSEKDSSEAKCVGQSDVCIELVELEETGDNDIDNDVCVIESSQESKKSTEMKIRDRLAHSISESSENDAIAESCSDEVISKLKLSGNLDTVTNKDEFISNIATQEINSSIQDDEAKRKLLASSSSSSAASKGSQSEASDSDATVIVKKNKRFKKKKRRKELNKSVSQSEVNSSDDDSEINRLLNLKSLRKRKRVSGSSQSSAENNSVTSSSDQIRMKKKKKSKLDEDEMDLFSDANSAQNNQNSEPESDHSNVLQNSPVSEPTGNGNADIIHRNMLLASDSSCSSNSDEECPASPEVSEPPKNRKKAAMSKANHEELDKENFLEEGCGRKKKRKYDPLLQGKFSLSSSESEQDKVTISQDRKINDEKYQKLLEKSKKRKEASRSILKENISNLSDDEQISESSGSSGSHPQNAEGPVNFVSCDPECVEISEDDSDEDDRTTVGYHEVSTSSSENDDIQCLPQSQDTVASNKSGRKNIKKIISSKELTEESKKAVKEEEERRKRLIEKEKLLSQTFSTPEVKKLILDFDKDTKQELVTVHPGLMEVLKDHQIEGVKFMWNTCFETVNATKTTSGSGCVLAHCMGLGKSCQIVTLVHTIINHPELNLRTVLIMCPKSVVYNWGDEFSKWLKRIEEMDPNSKKVEIFDLIDFDQIRMKERRLRDWQVTGGVMIMSYATFRVLAKPKNNVDEYSASLHENIKKHLIDPGPDVIVFDEGHILKNDSTDIHKAVDEVRTKRRIVLTGTPMQNSLMEYYFMVNLVKPNYLGDKKEFSNRFFNPINNGQFKDSTPQDVKIMKSRAHILFKKMDGIVHRYDSKVIEEILPKRFEFVLKLKLTELQINLYKSIIDSLKNEDASGTGLTQKEKNSRFMKNEKVLHYICNHPKVLKDSAAPSATEEQSDVQNDWKNCLEGIDLHDVKLSSKTVLFFEILQKCRENGDKLLVFSQQLKTLDLLEFFLRKASSTSSNMFQPNNSETKETWIREKDYFRLDGKTPSADRHKYCNIFNSPNNKRLRLGLLSTKAGGLGMNLIGANRAIIFDVSWNPSSDSQSIFRIYRFGQEKCCYVYRFVAKGTMEEKKYHRQVSKLSTSSRVVDKRQVGRHYMEGHLRELYDYNFDYNENRSIPRVPPDNLLADLLLNSDCIENFEEHDYLLRNILDEELSEEDRKKAWEDYEREKNAPPPSTSTANSIPLGPPSYSTFNATAGEIRYGHPNFSTNYQYAPPPPPPASNANSLPPRYFNHSAWNGTATRINYRPPFTYNFQHAFNPGSNNARNKTPAQDSLSKKAKEQKDLKKKVASLLKQNIIPLHYEPLNKPAPSNTKVSESAPKNRVSAGTTSAGKKNSEEVSKSEVNVSQNSVQNPQKRPTIIVKPKNPAQVKNYQNVKCSTPEKDTHQSAHGNPTMLQRLLNDFFSEGNDPSVDTDTGDKSVDSVPKVDGKEVFKDGQSVDTAPTVPAVNRTTPPVTSSTTVHQTGNRTAPPAGVKTSPATSLTVHSSGNKTTHPVGYKTIPPQASTKTAHPGGNKTSPVTDSTVHFLGNKTAPPASDKTSPVTGSTVHFLENRTTPLAGNKTASATTTHPGGDITSPVTGSTGHFLGNRSTPPAGDKTTPTVASATTTHPEGDKTTPPVTNSTVHPTDEAEASASSAQPSSLNTIIEDLKNFVKAKRNGDTAS